MNYPSAAGGLKNMFVAQILVLVGGVLTVVGAVGAVFTLGLSAILLLPASLLMLVGGILEEECRALLGDFFRGLRGRD